MEQSEQGGGGQVSGGRVHEKSAAIARDHELNPLLPDGTRKRILTGDRTTGKLHLGHYIGSLRNRVKLQGRYDTFILLADVQALTTHYDRPELLKQSVHDVALDYMAVGLIPYSGGEDDGSQCKIVIQSMVPAIAELTVYYGLLVPMSIILDNPTTKAEAEQQGITISNQENEPSIFDPALLNKVKLALTSDFPELGDVTLVVLENALLPLKNIEDVSVRQEMYQAMSEVHGESAMHAEISIAMLENKMDRYTDWPIACVRTSPAFKRALRNRIVHDKRSSGIRQMNYGFLGYPISQAADITFVGAHLVPVGEDQVPHIELTRDIVQRFNNQYGATLVTPQALLGGGTVKGLDGSAKMSKSLDNAIYLSDDYPEIWRRIQKAVTDPQRMRRTDPGRPEICNVFSYHELFNAATEPAIAAANLDVPGVPETAELCRSAGIGCVDCKKNLAKKLDAMLDPLRKRRAEWEARPDDLRQMLIAGTTRGLEEGEATLSKVRKAMRIDYF